MDLIVNFLYAEGNVLLSLCNIISFIFGLECLAYFVSILHSISRTFR